MAIGPQEICDLFPAQILSGNHDIDSHVIKLALYSDMSDISRTTTEYTTDNEITGGGYVAGGLTVATSIRTEISGSSPDYDFLTYIGASDIDVESATFTARGGLLYNSSLTNNNAIAVFNFGQNHNFTPTRVIALSSRGIDLFAIRT